MSTVAARTTYRHGDLRDALIAAGLDSAASGGPDAVVLREATRAAGVSPNAAYRHFADRQELVEAVSTAAQAVAADRMTQEIDAVTDTGDRETDARARFRAVGIGYIAFARESPGLFRTAFTVPRDLSRSRASEASGAAGLTPFQTLSVSLDDLVAVGALPPERRPGAELLAWSAVHGFAMLVLDGPLRELDRSTIDRASLAAVDMVERGI